MIDEYVVRFKAETQSFNNSLKSLKSQMRDLNNEGKGISNLTKDLRQITGLKIGKPFTGAIAKGIKEIERQISNLGKDLEQKTELYNGMRETFSLDGKDGYEYIAALTPAELDARGLERITDEFGNVYTVTKEVSGQLKDLAQEIVVLTAKQANLEELKSKFEAIRNQISLLGKIKWTGKDANAMDFGRLLVELGTLLDKSRELSPALAELADELKNLKMIDFAGIPGYANAWASETIQKVNDELSRLGLRIESVKEEEDSLRNSTDRTTNSFKSQEKQTGKSTNAFTKFFSKLKTMILYRMVRKALSDIANAFREGIENLYQYSKVTDGVFSGAMDTYASYSLYLKNSLATVVAPLIMSLIPVFQRLVEWIAQATDKIAEFFAALRGDDFYYSAVLAMKEYAKATEGAVAEQKKLKYLISGFDELNIYTPSRASSSGSATNDVDPSKMFEKVSVSIETKELAEKFSGIIDEIKGLGRWFDTDIKPILNDIWNSVETALGLIDWEQVKTFIEENKDLFKSSLELGKQLCEVLLPLAAMINNILMPSLNHLIKGLSLIISGFGNVISGLKNVVIGISKYFTLDWDGASKAFSQAGEDFKNAVANIGQGYGEVAASVFESLTAPLDGGVVSNKAGSWFTDMVKGVMDKVRGYQEEIKESVVVEPTPVNLQLDSEVVSKAVIRWFNKSNRMLINDYKGGGYYGRGFN